MGTTPILRLPFPEDTDYVIDGDDAIQALAEALEARLAGPGAISVLEADAALPIGAETVVTFPGAVAFASGFTFNGSALTYTGATARNFLVSAAVDIETATSDSVAATLVARRNDVVSPPVASSYDATTVATLAADDAQKVRRRHVHRLTFPVQLNNGDVLKFLASAAPSGTVKITSLTVFAIGPAAG